MKKSIRVFSVFLFLGVFIASPFEQALAAETVLKIASANVAGSLEDKYNSHFAEQVNKRNVGLKVQHIAGTPLGNAPQTMDQVVQGSIAMMGNEMAWIAPFDKDLAILNWGFTFRDAAHLQKFFESSLFAEMVERVRTNHGVRVLYAVPAQPRLVFGVKPFRKIEDVKGLKIRVPQIRAWVDLWKAFDASPTPLSFGEVFLAMKTGVIEAAGGPPSAAYSNNFHKSGKYIMNTGHLMSTSMIAINEKKFQALSPEQQKVIAEEAKNTLQWASKEAKSDSDAVLKKMVVEGAEIVEVDKTGFAIVAGEAGKKLESDGVWSNGLFEKIQRIK